MNLVKTYLDKDQYGGIGLFAAEFIAKGTNVWVQDDLDHVFSYEEMEQLPEPRKEEVLKFAYTEKGKYILCTDNARFYNHSFNPNVETIGQYEVAKIDIKVGEEMTCNYFKINDDYSRPIFEELKKQN